MQIAITGIGIISALGIGFETHRNALQQGSSALRQATFCPTIHHEFPIGEVPYSNAQLANMLGIDGTKISRNVLLGMVALRETINSTQLDADTLAHTPFINGTTVGGMDLTEQHFSDWLNGKYNALEMIQQHEADKSSTLLCEHFGLQYSTTISTACSSALNAIIHGAGLLRAGKAKQVIVGGTESMTRFHLNGFASLGILSTKVCRPFQEDRDGINLGEGAAYLVLEDADQAIRRNATVYGYLAGYGNRCDAYHQTASSPDGEGAFDAMQCALRMSNLHPKQISYINAHGTATPNNDASEWSAISSLFAEKMPVVESTKPLTGHTTSASGSIEAIFTIMRMQENHYTYAMSNAFGFGGNDSSIVLSQEPIEFPEIGEISPFHFTKQYASEGEWNDKGIIPPMQARRMTLLVRQLLVVAKQALDDSGVEHLDGIVVGTRWGGMIPTIQLLTHLVQQGEYDMSPALFMNSTHNSAAGTLARFLQCKGYNATIVASNALFSKALQDARLHLQSTEDKSILVCTIDEVDDTWRKLVDRVGITTQNKVQAQVIWRN